MSSPADDNSTSRQTSTGILLALVLIASIWWFFGTAFYDRVIPFYDSLTYQEGYRNIASIAQAEGISSAFTRAWTENGNNVILHKLFAAIAGPVLPEPREGMFVYLFAIHLLAGWSLFSTVRRLCQSPAPACWALATWLATVPFGLLRDGIGDQRLDLVTGAFYLLIATQGLRWLERPTVGTAAITGLIAALAALHRPLLVPTLALVGLLLAVVAFARHRQRAKQWGLQGLAAAAPVLVLTTPWVLRHLSALQHYYLDFGPDVANAAFAESARFNLSAFATSFGWAAGAVLLLGMVFSVRLQPRPRIQVFATVLALGALPLLTLVAFRTTGNVFVQQTSLFIPALLFAAFPSSKPNAKAHIRMAGGALALVIALLPFRLHRALAQERPGARAEIVHVVTTIADLDSDARVTGFHDLPASVAAMMPVARAEGLALSAGSMPFYPQDFGLSSDAADDVSSEAARQAVRTTLQRLARENDFVLLPTADTAFRLWVGLYSHRLLPLIRAELEQDPGFEHITRVGPVNEVYFDLYRIK